MAGQRARVTVTVTVTVMLPRCGAAYPLDDGQPGQCDPAGAAPRVSDALHGYCQWSHSTLNCLPPGRSLLLTQGLLWQH